MTRYLVVGIDPQGASMTRYLVVGIDPQGDRHERWATLAEILGAWRAWGLSVFMARPGRPLVVDGYTVWIEQ